MEKAVLKANLARLAQLFRESGHDAVPIVVDPDGERVVPKGLADQGAVEFSFERVASHVGRAEVDEIRAEVADEFRELESVDMVAAKTAARVRPIRPTGSRWTINVAKTSSLRSKVVSGETCA